MKKRFVIIGIIFGLLIGGLSFFHFIFLPNVIKQAILGGPQPTETISAEPARMETWAPYVPAIGTVTAVNGIDVASKVAGFVRKFHFDSGAEVTAGDKLVELDDATEQADLRNLEASMVNAKAELERRRTLESKGFAPKRDLEQAQSRYDELAAQIDRVRATIADKQVQAPWSGRLGMRRVDVGTYVEPGQALVWLQTVDPLYVDFTVPERDYARIKTGQKIEAAFSAYPGVTFAGTVEAIDARVDQATRSFAVRAKLPNPDRRIAAGMFADLKVVVDKPQPVLTVAETAVTYSLYGDAVYVVVPAKTEAPAQGTAPAAQSPAPAEPALTVERRFIRVGDARGNRLAVVEGLKEGEQVVTSGQLKLRPGAKVKVDNSVALAPAAQTKTE